MGNWEKNVQMLDKEKHERAYLILLSSVTAEVTQIPQPFLCGDGREAVAMWPPDSAGQTESGGTRRAAQSLLLRHEHGHLCSIVAFPFSLSPHGP